MRFWIFEPVNDEEVELRIDGDIEMDDSIWAYWFPESTVTPKGFMEELAQHQGKNITVWINSYGGDVYAASRIYTALMEHKGQVTVKIDGVAISAASVIAMAGGEILMSPTSIMMIHNPWTGAWGDSKELRHVADVLDEVKETIINAYQLKTGRSRNKISLMMDQETWMGAQKAVAEGFADGILYVQNDHEPLVDNTMMFSRVAIQNSAVESMKRFMEEYQKRMAANRNPPQESEDKREPQGAPLDLYSKIIANYERRLKHA